MADTPTTVTTANDPLWAAGTEEKILRAARAAMCFTPRVMHFEFPRNGPISKVVSRMQAVTIASVTPGTAQDAVAVSTDGATLTLSYKGAVHLIPDEVYERTVPTFSAAAMENLGLSMANQVETDGIGLATSLSTNMVGTSGSALTPAQFRRGVYLLEIANAPKSVAQEPALGLAASVSTGYFAILHPTQVFHLGDSITMTSAAHFGSDPSLSEITRVNAAFPPGYIGRFLGIDCYSSSLCTDDSTDVNGMILSPAAFGFGAKYLSEIKVGAYEVRSRSTPTSITGCFGFVELVDAYASRVRSSNTP